MKRIILLSFYMSIVCAISAQLHGDITLIDTVPDYYRSTTTPSAFYEYLEAAVCVDSTDKISVISIEDYELQLYESVDFGETWTKNSLTTGDEGDYFSVMMTCTHDGRRVIIYAYNPHVNYGQNLSVMNYFTLGANAYVETTSGWTKTTLFPYNSSNYGLVPFAIYTDRDGMVHAILHRRGWYTYGGDIHEAVYNPTTNSWSSVSLLYHYNETIDRATNYYAKVMQDKFGDIAILFNKQRSDNPNKRQLCYFKQNSGSWSGSTPVLIDNDYDPVYWHYDIADDADSNFYFMITTASGPSGPRMILSRNSFLGGDTLYPFTASDTLQYAQFIEIAGQPENPTIACYLKNTGKQYYSYNGSSFTQIPDIIFTEPGDSLNFYEYNLAPFVVPANKNFGSSEYNYMIHKQYQGTDPGNSAHVLAMPFKFTRIWFVPLSEEANILKFTIPGQLGSMIDTLNKEVHVVMPVGVNFSALTPDTIEVSPFASVNPPVGIAQDFTSPVTYVVTAQNTNVQAAWQVSVTDNTAIAELYNESIDVYPNPVDEYLFIKSGMTEVDLILYNLSGKKIISVNKFSTGYLYLGDVLPGVYILEIQQSSTRVLRRLIVY